jgi:hypothetical protein
MNRYLLPQLFLHHPLFNVLSKRERAKCNSIVSHITNLRNRANPYGYVSLPQKTLRKLAYGNYRDYVNLLINNKIVEENPKYSFKSTSPQFKRAFAKSYRLLSPYAESPLWTYTDEFPRKTKSPVDRSTVDDTISQAIKANYKGLSVAFPPWLAEEDKYEAFLLSEKLLAGVANAKRGTKVHRYYHTLLSASRVVRDLVLKEGASLYDYDMQAAFAADLLAVVAGPHISQEERSRFLSLIKEKDIYNEIAKISSFKARVKGKWGIHEGREGAKLAMRRFKFSKRHDVLKSGESNNPATKFFCINFPEIYGFIIAQNGESLSCEMQNLEASLFCEFLMPKAQDLGLWMLPMHDGWLCANAEAGATLKYMFEEEFNKRFGFKPQIACKTKNAVGNSLETPLECNLN